MRCRSVWWTDNDVSEQFLTFRLLAVLLIYCFLVYLHFRCVYVTVLCIYKQGRRSWGVAGVRTPLKMSHSFTQNCCCITASFTTSRMNTWTLSLHWFCLCWRCYHLISDQLQADTCPPINAFVVPRGLSYHGMAQDKTPKRGCGDPSSTILIDHSSYAVLPIDRLSLQLGWLTRGVDPRGWEVLTPWKYVGRVRVCFDPLEISHSFIQNCCCITASFTTSRMNTWTLSLHLHWSCLYWRCYHPYIWSAPTRQSSNQCLCCYTGYLSWPKTKLQNVGADDPPTTILIDGVPVDGVEEFIYRGSKQSSNGATADWMFYAGLDLPVQWWIFYRGYGIAVISVSAPKYTYTNHR